MLQARGSDRPRAERVGNTPRAFVGFFGSSEKARNCCSGAEGMRGPSEVATVLCGVRGAACLSRSIDIAEVPPQEVLPKRLCGRMPRCGCAADTGLKDAAQSISALRDPAAGVKQRISALSASPPLERLNFASEASICGDVKPGGVATLLCRRLNPAPDAACVDSALGGGGLRGTENSSGWGGEGGACANRAGAMASAGAAIAVPRRTGLLGRTDPLDPGGLTGI